MGEADLRTTPVPLGFLSDPSAQIFVVLSFEAATDALRDASVFSSQQAYGNSMALAFGDQISSMDPPEHAQYRKLIQPVFRRSSVEEWSKKLVVPTAEALVARLDAKKGAELVSALTAPFPFITTALMIGVPEDEFAYFAPLVRDLLGFGFDPDRGFAAKEKLGEYFTSQVEDRRLTPRADLMTLLAEASIDGNRLETEAVCSFLRLLLTAGMETTYRALSNLIVALLTHQDQWRAICADPELIPSAVEEGLRWSPPSVMMPRVATQDTTLAGVAIPAGSVVFVATGIANRDPSRWEHASEFDSSRKPLVHLAFGSGPHMCLGAALARREIAVSLGLLVERFPNMRFDTDYAVPRPEGLLLRSPSSIHVQFGTR
jgi:cytochrome P450